MPYPTYEMHSNAPQQAAEHRRGVEVRAYYLWQSAGRPLGMRTPDESWQDHFWKAAERLVFNEEAWNAALRCASVPC